MSIIAYVCFSYIGEHSWQARVERSSQLLEIGKKVALIIRDSKSIPQNMEELRTRTELSEPQWGFLQSNKVIYLPPKILTNTEVILRMPYGRGSALIITLEGSMRKE